MNIKTQQITSGLLALLSVAGLGATTYFTAKVAPKANKKLKEAEEKKGSKLTFTESVKTAGKDYIPVVIAGSATAISIISSTIISRKTEASLGATAVALDGLYRRYKGTVDDVFGKDAQKKILHKFVDEDKKPEMAAKKDDKKLYFNDYIGFFYASPEKVKDAYANMNMRLNANPCSNIVDDDKLGYCTFEEFINECQGEVLDKETYNKFKNFGWSTTYLEETCQDYWIYLGENPSEEPDDKYTELTFISEEPIINPRHYKMKESVADEIDPELGEINEKQD